MTKRIKLLEDQYFETGTFVDTAKCFTQGCSTRLAWETIEGGTIHDGSEFWLEDCKCHEEDKQKYCSECQKHAACEECYESQSS